MNKSKSKSSQRGRPPKPGSLNWIKRNGPAPVQQMNEELSHIDTRINIIAVAAGSGPSKNKNNSSGNIVFFLFLKSLRLIHIFNKREIS